MDMEKIGQLKTGLELQSKIAAELKGKHEQFKKDNEVSITMLAKVNTQIETLKDELSKEAVAIYEKTDEKSVGYGIKVTERKRFVYDKNKALEWAKVNMPLLVSKVLDENAFKRHIKTKGVDYKKEKLEFVTKKIDKKVTFPPKIVIDVESND